MLQSFWPFNSHQCWCLSSPCNMNAISTMQVKALFWNRTKRQKNVEKLEGRFTNHTLRVKVNKWILPPFCLRKWKSKWFLESLVWQLLTEIHLKFTICDNWRFCEHFCKHFCVAVWIFLHLKSYASVWFTDIYILLFEILSFSNIDWI